MGKPAISPVSAALRLRCPQCGEGKLYSGFLQTAKKCDKCGFDIEKHDAADGPAFCAIFIVGTVVVILAIIVELLYTPPMWLHMLLWIPFILAGSFVSLIWAKALFIAIQYKTKGF